MRQVWITKTGPPEVLELRDAPDPAPGPREVRIRVRASGVNFADILARLGLYPDSPKPPCVVGYEVAGEVDACGSDVGEWTVGQQALALTRFGGYSDVVCVPAERAFPLPPGLRCAQAVAIPINYGTAYQMMIVMGSLKAGERVLVHSAGGGVGLAAIDLAKIVGAEVIGTASARKHDVLRQRGVTHTIDPQTLDFETEVMRVTEQQGVHLVLDPIGGSSWRKGYRCLAPTGRLVVFGFSGAAPGKKRSYLAALQNLVSTPWLTFHPLTLMSDNKALIGVNFGHLWHQPEMVASWIGQILEWYREGKIHPTVDSEFPLAEASAAHHHIQDRKNVGKVVLVP